MLECICIRDRFQIQLGRSKVSIKQACFHLTKRWLACLPALWIKILQNLLCIGCAQRILAGKICWGSASLKRKTFSPSWKSRGNNGCNNSTENSQDLKKNFLRKVPDLFILKVKFYGRQLNESMKDSTMLTLCM